MDERADDIDAPIAYCQRVRNYYQALGYETPYRWLSYNAVPFTPLKKPLSECSVAIVTTAAPYDSEMGDQGPGAAYNGAAKFFSVYTASTGITPDLRISHIAYDRINTSAKDMACWFPLAALRHFARQGVIGKVSDYFYGLPTNRSHRVTTQVDCPDLVERITRDDVDAVVLVPNCPVCHQSVSAAARQLEAAGLVTVVMGCAKDIVEGVGVPRFLFSDFPLGNAAGKPDDEQSQQDTLKLALDLVGGAPAARTTVQSPQRWSKSSAWKKDYCNIDALDADGLQKLRMEFDRQKSIAKS